MGNFDEFRHSLPAHGIDIGITVIIGIGRIGNNAEYQHLPIAPDGPVSLYTLTFFQQTVFCQRNAVGCHHPGKSAENVIIPDKLLNRRFKQSQRLHPVLRISRHLAAGTAAGPPVLIIKPDFQSLFFTGISSGIDEIKPLISQIFRDQTGTGMHKVAAKAHFAQHMRLADQLIFFQFSVP